MKRLLTFSLLYIGLTLIPSCNCGESSPSYISGVNNIRVLAASDLGVDSQNRFSEVQGESLQFLGLALSFDLEAKKVAALNTSGFACMACSVGPAHLQSDVSGISIKADAPFEGHEAGDELRSFFKVDPLTNNLDTYQLRSIFDFEEKAFSRAPEEVYFLYNEELTEPFSGKFRVVMQADGKIHTIESQQYTWNFVID